MGESSASPRNLDPSAKEFRPTPNPNLIFTNPITFLPPPPHLLFPYPPLYPLPPPPTFCIHLLQTPLPPLNDVAHVRASSSQLTLPPASTCSPSRTLLLTSVPPNLPEATVREEVEVFGEVRAVEMEKAHEGLVKVHFFDLRDSEAALREIRAKYMHQESRIRAFFDDVSVTFDAASLNAASFRAPGLIAGCAVWARFAVPDFLDCVPDCHNHGTIVIFNLDSHVSAETLKHIFEAFGPVKELRDAPLKHRQKFLEFFDVRHAAKAAREMNGKVIHGKQITIDFSRPGGHGSRWSHHPTSLTPARNKNICTSPKNNMFPATTIDAAPHRSHPNRARQITQMTGTGINGVDGENDSGLECKVADEKMLSGGNRIRPGKNRIKGLDSRFMIREDCGDSRTTVMIKNIPNKYSQKLLLSLLDNHCAHTNDRILGGGGGDHACLSSYDFFYLPMDFNNKCNMGYGFVNMTSSEATMRLYKAFHHQSWEVSSSRKISQVTYARVQALKEHFRKSKFPSGSDELFPVVFHPPRDGRRQLTPPQPVYGLLTTSSDDGADAVLTFVGVNATEVGGISEQNGGGEVGENETEDRVAEVKEGCSDVDRKGKVMDG